MPQRDCGCGELATPTLEQLLTAARVANVPRIRPVNPPPVKVGASMRGWMRWGLIDRRGKEAKGGQGPNLILDQGLDQIATQEILLQLASGSTPATYFPIIRYAAVGTDNTSPAAGQTGLGAELARVDTTYQAETITRPGNGVYELTRFVEFDYDEGNGNLTEWGFSSNAAAGANLFNRALFLDGGGSPDPVTKTSDFKLRIAYTLEVTLSPVTLTAGAFTVTNVGVVNGDYTLLGSTSPSSVTERCKAPDLMLFSALARGVIGTVFGGFAQLSTAALRADSNDRSAVTYSTTISNTLDSGVNMVAREVAVARDAYVSGSFERTGGAWKFDTSYGNLAPLKAFLVSGASENWATTDRCERAGYVFDLDLGDEFTKDNEHTLTIGVPTVTWGRA